MSASKSSNQVSQETLSKDELMFKSHLAQHLDNTVEALDYNITSKLSAARHRAMAGERSKSNPWFSRVSWQMAAGGAFAAVMVGFLVSHQVGDSTPSSTPSVAVIESPAETVVATTANIIEDLHLLSATDDIDFYQSVEFLEWMEMNSG